MQADEYRRAQAAIAELKSAILALLEREGIAMTNAAIGRSLCDSPDRMKFELFG